MKRPLHLVGPFAGLPGAFWRLWLATLVNRLGGFVVPFLAIFLQGQRGLSTAEAGTIVAFFGAGSVVAGPLGGLLADRVGRKATIVLGMLGSASSMLWIAFFAADGAALVAGCFGLGLAFDLPRVLSSVNVLPPVIGPMKHPNLRWRFYNIPGPLERADAGWARVSHIHVAQTVPAASCGSVPLLARNTRRDAL